MATTVEQMARLMPDATQLLSDEPEMESTLHYAQLAMLVAMLERHWRARRDFFIGANLTVYYSRQQLKTRDFRGPDFFLVLGAEKRERTSWVVWEEAGKYPDLIIELLSDSTAEVDRDLKKELYQDHFRTPEYFWFSPVTQEFAGFRLAGRKYAEIETNEHGWRWSEVLNLFLGIEDGRLRYFTADGVIVPTPDEAADEEAQRAVLEAARADYEAQRAAQEAVRADYQAQRAVQEAVRADYEAQRAARLAAKLRELGGDPDKL